MKRPTLGGRIVLLCVSVAVLTAILAGALTVGLVRNNGISVARANLARLADVAQALAANEPSASHPEARLRVLLADLNVRSAVISNSRESNTIAPIIRESITPSEIRAALAGRSVSAERSVGGNEVFLEIRPIASGALVLAQRRGDALAPNQQAIQRVLIALVIGAGVAVALGASVAWRLGLPLRRTAAAAHALADGSRDVAVPAQGPREVAEVAEAITSLAGALRTSESRQRDFLMSVSHDLRTPLTAIRGYAESLAEGAVDVDDSPRVAAAMTAEALRMQRLVDDLLDLARLDADDFRIVTASVDLGLVVADAAVIYQARCADEGVVFSLEAPLGPLNVTTDSQRLRQALDGLFDNALRVTPVGARIVLAMRRDDDTAVIEIRDSGPGLTDDDLAVAFTRGILHQRYEGVRRVGTGLGLAIVSRLIAQLGGSAEADHAPEGGACFAVRIPIKT